MSRRSLVARVLDQDTRSRIVESGGRCCGCYFARSGTAVRPWINLEGETAVNSMSYQEVLRLLAKKTLVIYIAHSKSH